MNKTSKQELMSKWADRVKVSKVALTFYWEQLMEVIHEELKQGNEIYMPGVGRFYTVNKKPTKSNLTGQLVPKHRQLKFTFNTALARYVRVMSREI